MDGFKYSKSPRRQLAGLAAVTILSIGLLLGLEAHREYQRELEAVEERLLASARLAGEHAELSLSAADLLLTQVEAYIQSQGIEALVQDPGYREALFRTIRHTPQLWLLLVADAQGGVVFSTTALPSDRAVNLSDRDYFQALRNGAEHYIGEPVAGRISGERSVPVGVRIETPAGEFQGVIVATLKIGYFEEFYEGMREDFRLRLGLYRRDGTILSLNPAPVDGPSVLAREGVQRLIASGGERSFITRSAIDGSRRVVASHHLERYPVLVSTSYKYRSLMQSLYPAFARNATIFLAFATGICLAALVLLRQMKMADRRRDEIHRLLGFVQGVREQEQKRIARELHDELGQLTTALKLDIGWIRQRVSDPRFVADKLTDLDVLADAMGASVRNLLAGLRPQLVDQVRLPAAVRVLLTDFTAATGVQHQLHLGHEQLELGEEVGVAAYRIIQEALTNIARHAEATLVKVSLVVDGQRKRLEVRIVDNGRGFDPHRVSEPGSYGLLGIRERAGLLNGTLTINSAPARGTEILVELPIQEQS